MFDKKNEVMKNLTSLFCASNGFFIHQTLWPNGIFFTKLDGYKGNSGISQFDKQSSGTGTSKKSCANSFEFQLEASRNASEVKKLLLGQSLTCFDSFLWSPFYVYVFS